MQKRYSCCSRLGLLSTEASRLAWALSMTLALLSTEVSRLAWALSMTWALLSTWSGPISAESFLPVASPGVLGRALQRRKEDSIRTKRLGVAA